MIHYEHLPLSPEILQALGELEIDYVFQPIFYPDGKTIYAREALMRPHGKTVVELIDDYTKQDKLHVLEVATFFGAAQAYFMRGYTEKLSINSFPCECFSDEETRIYVDYYGEEDSILMIEMLEYPEFSEEKALQKKKVASVGKSILALDDFGVGLNNMDKVHFLDPHIVKIDRSLLSGIDHNPEKQEYCRNLILSMHSLNKMVVAEGVETKEEFDYLVGLGADLFQGYYLAKPM